MKIAGTRARATSPPGRRTTGPARAATCCGTSPRRASAGSSCAPGRAAATMSAGSSAGVGRPARARGAAPSCATACSPGSPHERVTPRSTHPTGVSPYRSSTPPVSCAHNGPMTTTHAPRCIESATTSIDENNLDTLVERGINDRLAGCSDWPAQQRLIDGELEASYEAGTLSRPTPELAKQWLAEGIVTCRCDD